MNPGNILKLMNAKNTFEANHPKFVAFLSNMFRNGVEEGTIIEMTVTKPNGTPVTANIKVQASDLELIEQLKGLK